MPNTNTLLAPNQRPKPKQLPGRPLGGGGFRPGPGLARDVRLLPPSAPAPAARATTDVETWTAVEGMGFDTQSMKELRMNNADWLFAKTDATSEARRRANLARIGDRGLELPWERDERELQAQMPDLIRKQQEERAAQGSAGAAGAELLQPAPAPPSRQAMLNPDPFVSEQMAGPLAPQPQGQAPAAQPQPQPPSAYDVAPQPQAAPVFGMEQTAFGREAAMPRELSTLGQAQAIRQGLVLPPPLTPRQQEFDAATQAQEARLADLDAQIAGAGQPTLLPPLDMTQLPQPGVAPKSQREQMIDARGAANMAAVQEAQQAEQVRQDASYQAQRALGRSGKQVFASSPEEIRAHAGQARLALDAALQGDATEAARLDPGGLATRSPLNKPEQEAKLADERRRFAGRRARAQDKMGAALPTGPDLDPEGINALARNLGVGQRAQGRPIDVQRNRLLAKRDLTPGELTPEDKMELMGPVAYSTMQAEKLAKIQALQNPNLSPLVADQLMQELRSDGGALLPSAGPRSTKGARKRRAELRAGGMDDATIDATLAAGDYDPIHIEESKTPGPGPYEPTFPEQVVSSLAPGDGAPGVYNPNASDFLDWPGKQSILEERDQAETMGMPPEQWARVEQRAAGGDRAAQKTVAERDRLIDAIDARSTAMAKHAQRRNAGLGGLIARGIQATGLTPPRAKAGPFGPGGSVARHYE